MSEKLISRIAPTPSGYLHVGNGINFVLTYLLTCKKNGHLHLRIDDYDTPRVKNEYIENIFYSLDYLGIEWDSGAQNVSDYHKNYKFFKDRYKKELKRLKDFIYPCECSRKQIQQTSKDGKYNLTCKNKNLTYNPILHALRCELKSEDIIIWRKGDLPSYNFASLIDDEKLQTSLIVRGKDLLFCSSTQLQLARKLKATNFLHVEFIHHKLVTDKDGNKLSKSTLAPSLLNESARKFIYKEVADVLKLPKYADENISSLKDAFVNQPFSKSICF